MKIVPRRSWSQVAAGSYFWTHVGLIFGPPEPLKIVLSLWRGAIFGKNGMTRPGAQNGAHNDPKIEPQTTPRDLQIAKKITPNRRFIFGPISAPFWTIWGVQNDPQKHPKTAFGAQGSLGGLQGTLWGAFGVHFGLILSSRELIFELFGFILDSFSSFAFGPPGPQL